MIMFLWSINNNRQCTSEDQGLGDVKMVRSGQIRSPLFEFSHHGQQVHRGENGLHDYCWCSPLEKLQEINTMSEINNV